MSLGELLPVAQQVLDAVPEQVKQAFTKTAGQLLGGLTSIPAAWSKRQSQRIDDMASAQSVVTAALAKAVADGVVRDPSIIRAATEVMLPPSIRRAQNLVAVVQAAAEHVNDEASGDGAPAPPDDDWVARFMRFAEDASSDRLRDLFGRILAGEVVRPGSFSTSTLRAVSELDQGIATDFAEAWAKCVGEAVDYSPEWQRGQGFSRWLRLVEAGLMASSAVVQFLPPFQPSPFLGGAAGWSPMSAPGVTLMVVFNADSTVSWHNVEFTRVGREIGSLLAKPDYVTNIREAARRLPTPGVVKIELHREGEFPELIYAAP